MVRRGSDRPGYAISRLLASAEQRDWSAVFKLDVLANGVERTVIELDHRYYSQLARNTHSEIVFSFSAPVSTVDGFLFTGRQTEGFYGRTASSADSKARLTHRLP